MSTGETKLPGLNPIEARGIGTPNPKMEVRKSSKQEDADGSEKVVSLFRSFSGKTNPGEFRVDPDGLSLSEKPDLRSGRFNLEFVGSFSGEKVQGTIARLFDVRLLRVGAFAMYTPNLPNGIFDPFHWSLIFPGMSIEDAKRLLSEIAKTRIPSASSP